MYELDHISVIRLQSCHTKLISVIELVRNDLPVFVISGHRTREWQDRAFREGTSKKRWPDSRHNSLPSEAVDITIKIDGKPIWGNGPMAKWEVAQLAYMGAHVKSLGYKLGVPLRWGGDWDSDHIINPLEDQKVLNDMFHFELVE